MRKRKGRVVFLVGLSYEELRVRCDPVNPDLIGVSGREGSDPANVRMHVTCVLGDIGCGCHIQQRCRVLPTARCHARFCAMSALSVDRGVCSTLVGCIQWPGYDIVCVMNTAKSVVGWATGRRVSMTRSANPASRGLACFDNINSHGSIF